jgi:hypothetical protein
MADGTAFDVTNDETIPTADRPYVNRLRRFLQDQDVLNTLEQAQESTNVDLYFAMQDVIDEVNITPPETTYTALSEVPWVLLKLGGTLNVLVSQGILSARNQLTYNDTGGIQVSDVDKYGRYVNWFNVLINKYQRSLMSWKLTKNIEEAYGEVPSEYVYVGGYKNVDS